MDKVSEIRQRELRQLKHAAYLNASFSFTFTCAPFLVRYSYSTCILFFYTCELGTCLYLNRGRSRIFLRREAPRRNVITDW